MRPLAVLALLVAAAGALAAAAPMLAPAPASGVPVADGPGAFRTLVCGFQGPSRPLEDCNVRATPSVGPANEVDLAIDPADPQHMVVVGKGYHYPRLVGSAFVGGVITPYATTFDGGRTWTEGFVQPLDRELAELPLVGEVGTTEPPESDPVVEFAADGTVLVQTLRVGGERGLPMYRSADGGLTFTEVGYAYVGGTDKNWMTTDPFTGGMYTVTLHDGGTGFTRSDDHGLTWSAPRKVGDFRFPGIDVDGTGAIHVVGVGGASGVNAVRYVRSADGGATWTPRVDIAPHPTGPTNPCNGRLFRISTIPVLAASRAGDDVFVAYAAKAPDAPNVARTCPDVPAYDVFLVQSHDGGRTWSAPRRMNDDDGLLAAQFMATVAVSPNGRDVHVAWMDQRADPSGVLADIYYAHSPDGGATWDPNLKVTDRPFATTLSHHQSIVPQHTGVFVGDYIGLSATDGKAVVAFPDTRYGRADIFVATIV